jgi:hypothetical protein
MAAKKFAEMRQWLLAIRRLWQKTLAGEGKEIIR